MIIVHMYVIMYSIGIVQLLWHCVHEPYSASVYIAWCRAAPFKGTFKSPKSIVMMT